MMLKQTNPSGWDFIHVSHKLKFLSPQTHPPFHSSTSLLRELSLLIPDFFVSIHTFQSDLVTAIPVEGNHRNKEPPGCIPSRSEHHLMATSHVGILCLQNTGSNVFISFPSAIPIKKTLTDVLHLLKCNYYIQNGAVIISNSALPHHQLHNRTFILNVGDIYDFLS